jgi:hypothetical protein
MTKRGDQIGTIGANMGKFLEGDLIELCLDFIADRGSSLATYREDLGNRVQRYFKIEERDDEAGYIEVEVRFTEWREPDKRFRIHLKIEELET